MAATGDRFDDAGLAAYLEITPDNRVHLVNPSAEMGQGSHTALPLIIADELGADWSLVEVHQSWADQRFANPLKGYQATGRSMSVRGYHDLFRQLGATARTLLCEAAALDWGVPRAECDAVDSQVVHAPSGRRLRFAELMTRAAALPLPAEVELRPAARLRFIGRDQPRKDIPAKVRGEAEFGADVRIPGMKIATLRASPVFGSRLLRFDAERAERQPGVHRVVALPTAVAVVAETFWQARQALDLVEAVFETGAHAGVNDAGLGAQRAAALAEPGLVWRDDGDARAALGGTPEVLRVRYEVPYLAHATMEPMSCTARVRDGRCELWAPTQGPGRLRNEVARQLGIDAGSVEVRRTYLGGGFGRRWQPDFGVQAALIARAAGVPVKLLWSREEDLRQDFYRPAFTMALAGGLDAAGRLVALDLKLAGASVTDWGKPPRPPPERPDSQVVGGLVDAPYGVPHFRVEWVATPAHVPVGVWRSVAHSHNAVLLECGLDELAARAGQDPVAFRLALLEAQPRYRAVLRVAAERAGWGEPLAEGRGRGVALAESYGAVVAQVAEVTVRDGKLRVDRVTCAVDCGLAVQPGNVRAQVEGGLIFGLSALLYGEIAIRDGRAVPGNFNDYPMVTLRDCPAIDVHLVETGAPMGGVGEPGTPPIAPAVLNAIYAATGQRIRSLPLARHGLV